MHPFNHSGKKTGGGLYKNFIQGGATLRSNPLPFVYHFAIKRYPFGIIISTLFNEGNT